MTNSADEPGHKPDSEPGGISDDQLPEDLRPTDDNPLAKNPDESDDTATSGPTSAEQADGATGGSPQEQPT